MRGDTLQPQKDTPESGVSLKPKQAYRLQCQLESALTRVLVVLERMAKAGLSLNAKNLALAIWLAGPLGESLQNPGVPLEKLENFTLGVAVASANIKRRRKQTVKRHKRREWKEQVENMRACGIPIPEKD
jgi:hypothetical protein